MITSVGPVSLVVPNQQRSVDFYRNVLGFFLLSEQGDAAVMGTADGKILLTLSENPEAPPVSRRVPGLFHFAVLFPSRAALGKELAHLIKAGWKLSGAGDHLVSEALYLDDPDGNGIELYYDRPRSVWEFEDGKVKMDTLSVDIESLLAEGAADTTPWTGIPNGTTMGHVHLKVNDVDAAGTFYQALLGFDLMATWEKALFVAAGGYHHHLGLNAWVSNGSEKRPEFALGLRGFSVNFNSGSDVKAAVARLKAAGYEVDTNGLDPFVHDPAGNGLWLHA